MAIQYSLSYDADGNPSLVKNTVKGSAPVIKTDFNIGAYEPKRTVSTDYTFTSQEEPFNEEVQLKILKTYIDENDSDPKTFDKDVRDRDRLTSMDKDKISRLTQFTGKQSALDYEKYVTRSARAGDIKTLSNVIGLAHTNPITTILSTGAKLVGDYSDREISKLLNNMYASQEYNDYMKELDKQYDIYGDYDVYNDFRGGLNYRDEKGYLNVTSGTIFDADTDPADEGVQPTPTIDQRFQPSYTIADVSNEGSQQTTTTQSDRATAGDPADYRGPTPF